MADEQELLMREVDEEVRRDKFHDAWRKYRIVIIGTAVSIVLAVAANTFWTSHLKQKRDAASDAFAKALVATEVADADVRAVWADARPSLSEGYVDLSYMEEAAALLKAEKFDEAVTVYSEIANNNDANKRIRDLAQLLAGRIEFSQGKYAEARGRLATISADENTWAFSAQETLALIDIEEGNFAGALAKLTLLISNPNTPASINQRATDLRNIIEPQILIPAEELPAENEVEGTDDVKDNSDTEESKETEE